MSVNIVQFSFKAKADVCSTFVRIHTLCKRVGYVVFTVDHPAVAVELKVDRPIAYLLTWTLSVAYFIVKLLRISETVA